MKNIGYILCLAVLLSQCRPKEDKMFTQFAGKPQVPSSIKREHESLLDKIDRLAQLQDSTGISAKKLSELMHHHFNEEEDYVLPPLGLLPSLAEGSLPEQAKAVIGLTEKLKAQLNHMSAEHQLIKAYVDELLLVAVKENHPEVIELEKEIKKHAATEEEILFPAAILLGEYLKLKTREAEEETRIN